MKYIMALIGIFLFCAKVAFAGAFLDSQVVDIANDMLSKNGYQMNVSKILPEVSDTNIEYIIPTEPEGQVVLTYDETTSSYERLIFTIEDKTIFEIEKVDPGNMTDVEILSADDVKEARTGVCGTYFCVHRCAYADFILCCNGNCCRFTLYSGCWWCCVPC